MGKAKQSKGKQTKPHLCQIIDNLSLRTLCSCRCSTTGPADGAALRQLAQEYQRTYSMAAEQIFDNAGVAVITGGGSGFGLEAASCCAKAGMASEVPWMTS